MADRSSADATRFTATQPHAYSQSNPISSSPSSTSSATSATPSPPRSSGPVSSHFPPPGFNGSQDTETPKEKLARLRAARIASRQIHLTRWERIVIRGRVWADRAHKVTTTSLALAGLIMFGFSAFAVVDMVLHNRKKRAAFLAAQHEIYQARVITAIETEKAGLPLEEHQILVLARERLMMNAEERKKTMSWWKRFKIGFSVDLDKADPIITVPSEKEMLRKMGVSETGIFAASLGNARINAKGELEGVEETELVKAVKRRRQEMGLEEKAAIPETFPVATPVATEREGSIEREGGMLDRLGERSANDASAATGQISTWLSWGK